MSARNSAISTSMIRAGLAAIALTAALDGQTAAPAGQTPPSAPPRDRAVPSATGTARIRGRIVSADANAPLRRAQVTLFAEPDVRRLVTTDAEGRYEFADLPAGRFTVTAAKGGYATLQYGQRRPFEAGRAIALAPAQILSGLDLALPRGGVIAGRITDRFGDPVVGAEIHVDRYRYNPEGQRHLEAARATMLQTNDLGEFRAFGLMPGQYVVSASTRGLTPLPGQPGPIGPSQAFLLTYNPGTANVAEAQTVSVDVGQEKTVLFALVTGRMSRVSGTVVDSTGRPAAGASLMLTSTSGGSTTGTGVGTVAADGSFSIGSISPGEHSIEVRFESTRANGATASEFANLPISASADDVTGFVIATSTGAAVSGRVEWEGTAPRTGGSGTTPLRITTSDADGRRAILGAMTSFDTTINGTVGEDNTFRIAGIAGRVLIAPVGVPPQWMLQAVTLDGADVTNVHIDAARFGGETRLRVVLTDKVTEVSGSVANARGESVTDYVVVVVPEERVELPAAAASTRAVRPEPGGAFRVRALPPGRYVAVAVDGLEPGNEWDPVFQAMVRDRGRRFTLAEGQVLTVSLSLLQ